LGQDLFVYAEQCDGNIIAEILPLIQSFLLLSFQFSVCFIGQQLLLKPSLAVQWTQQLIFAYFPDFCFSLYQGPCPGSDKVNYLVKVQ